MSVHDVVTCVLVYLEIGSLIWMVLDGLGLVQAGYLASRARGEASPAGALVLATMMVIVLWPRLVFIWLKGMWGFAAK
jgi:hypothetical protein